MRAGRIVVWAVAALLLAAACWVLWAQETETAEEVGGPEQDEDSVRIKADDLRREGDMYYLQRRERPVVLAHKDIKLYCDKAVYNREQDTAHAEGSPKVQDPNTTITGDYIDADFGKEIAVITENVTVVTQRKKQKPEGEEAGEEEATANEDEEPKRLKDYWEKKTVITCDKIEYQYNEDVKIATATSRVKAVQEDKTAYADKAVYEELKDIITLTGDVRVTTDRGDEFRSPHVVISVEEDWIQAKDAVGLTIRRDKEEEEQEAPAD